MAKARKSKILDTVRALELPNNPLDDIIDQVLILLIFSKAGRDLDSFLKYELENSDLEKFEVFNFFLDKSLWHWSFESFILPLCTVGRSRPRCRNDWTEGYAGASTEWKRGYLPSAKHVSIFIPIDL